GETRENRRGHLVAEALSSAGRHEDHHVAAGENRFYGRLLGSPEIGVAEVAPEHRPRCVEAGACRVARRGECARLHGSVGAPCASRDGTRHWPTLTRGRPTTGGSSYAIPRGGAMAIPDRGVRLPRGAPV